MTVIVPIRATMGEKANRLSHLNFMRGLHQASLHGEINGIMASWGDAACTTSDHVRLELIHDAMKRADARVAEVREEFDAWGRVEIMEK